MSRNIRPNRAGVGALPAKAPARFEEYDDEYPSRNRYHSDDYPTQNNGPGRSSDARRGPVNNGRYDQTTSGSSAGSTLLDRMKNKNQDYSGRGSVEDEYDSPREQKATWARNPGATSLRTQRTDRQAQAQAPPPRDESRVANDPGSAGNTLWGRVVSAAGSLTINVSKAWDSNAHDGPETPPGGETRLTKVMKEYYLQRARAPVDLPHWLFEEHERMPTRPPPREKIVQNNARNDRGRYDEDYGDDYAQSAQPLQGRGALRDVYEKAASKPAPTRSAPAASAYDSTASTGESKATSRLRAMREAKRGNISGASAYTPSKYDVDYEDGGSTEPPPPRQGGNRSRW